MKADLKAKKAEMLKTMAGIPDHSFKARTAQSLQVCSVSVGIYDMAAENFKGACLEAMLNLHRRESVSGLLWRPPHVHLFAACAPSSKCLRSCAGSWEAPCLGCCCGDTRRMTRMRCALTVTPPLMNSTDVQPCDMSHDRDWQLRRPPLG